jgi:hypothetical protein
MDIEILPTKERIAKSLGVVGDKNRIIIQNPIDWLYAHGMLGEQGSKDAEDRVNAARQFTNLYVVTVERPNSTAQAWDRFLSGLGAGEAARYTNDDYQVRLQFAKRKYGTICTKLCEVGKWGRGGVDLLVDLCGEGLSLKAINIRHAYPKGMAKRMITDVLDDLIRII